MRHYSGMIDSLLEQHAYDEMKKVTEHINMVADENKVARYCSNMIANTMLCYMMEKAYSLEIEVQRDIFIPKEIPVDNYYHPFHGVLYMESIDACRHFL